MRTLLKATLAGLALASAFLPIGRAFADSGYTVLNTHAASPIQQVWSANSGGVDPWRAATMLHEIAPGTQSGFSTSAGVCLLDIKVQFADGYAQIFSNVNVCRGDRVIAI